LKSAEQNCQPPYLLEIRHDYEKKTEDDSTRQTVFKFANAKVASGFHCLDDSFFSRNFFGSF
jgi:hypothetical protein